MSPAAITRRLDRVAELADLAPERRLAAKIDMSPAAVSRRLRKVGEITELCLFLGRAGRSLRSGRTTSQS